MIFDYPIIGDYPIIVFSLKTEMARFKNVPAPAKPAPLAIKKTPKPKPVKRRPWSPGCNLGHSDCNSLHPLLSSRARIQTPLSPEEQLVDDQKEAYRLSQIMTAAEMHRALDYLGRPGAWLNMDRLSLLEHVLGALKVRVRAEEHN